MTRKIAPITVLLPVNKLDEFFPEALKSILAQTFKNFKVLIIANRKIDFTDYEKLDNRVFHLKVDAKSNLSQKLNAGIEVSKSKYIARMDADDVAHQDRFLLQFNFLENNQEIDLLGTGIRFIGSLPNHRNYSGEYAFLPSNNNDLLAYMLNKNPFFHPTVMIRTETLNKFGLRYNERYVRSQDYELWTRAAGKLVFANLRKPLLDYRLHEKQSGVIGAVDSQYYANLAKLKFCFKTVINIEPNWIIAFKNLPLRIRELLMSVKNRGF